MYAEDITVNYKGFKPSENAATELKVLTERLHNESPSDSSLSATFSKAGGNKYQGFIKISFSEGSFFARAKDYDLNLVITKLVERVREQLNRWKTVRFESTKVEGDLSYGGESY